MIKFNCNVDICNSNLLVCSGLAGFSSVLLSKLLIANYNFNKIGFYFSEYMQTNTTILPNNIQINGELFFNKDKKLLILVLSAGVQKFYQNKFFEEFNNNLLYKYNIKDCLFISGMLPVYQNDEEIKNKEITPYYLTNNNEYISRFEKSGAKSFEKLCNIVKTKYTKPLEELKYASHIGFIEKYIKYQNRSNKYKKESDTLHYYNFVGVFIRSPLDILAALSLYNFVGVYFELTNKEFTPVEKKYLNIENKLSSLQLDESWSMLTSISNFD